MENIANQIKSLALYIQCAHQSFNESRAEFSTPDYREFLSPSVGTARQMAAFMNFGELLPLGDISLDSDQYDELVDQIFNGATYLSVSLPFPPPPEVKVPPHPVFFDKYFENVIGNDIATRESVTGTMERINELLSEKDKFEQRASGLVVGRVQSGKTRNYIGLILKAIDEGWNVIIVLTSDNVALADQTRDRIYKDLTKSGLVQNFATELQFLNGNQKNNVPYALDNENQLYAFWGVAMKQRDSLQRIPQWLESSKQLIPKMRVLVIDDEADNATPDTRASRNIRLEDDELEDLIDSLQSDENEQVKILGDWLEGLLEHDFPDTAAKTKEAEIFSNLKDTLADNNGKKVIKKILGTPEFRKMLLISGISEEDGSSYDYTNEIENHFSKTGEESPLYLIKALNAILDISNTRSTINGLICHFVDKGLDGEQFSYNFQKCVYIGYTATPYACILNERPDQTPLYADFIHSLEKSPKYFGMEEIFGEEVESTKPRMDIVRSIEDDERRFILQPLQGIKDAIDLTDGKKTLWELEFSDNLGVKTNDPENGEDEIYDGEWKSMKKALAWLFCSAAARRHFRMAIYPTRLGNYTEEEKTRLLNDRDVRWTSMLVNISHKKETHNRLQETIKKYIRECCEKETARIDFMRECRSVWSEETSKFTKQEFDSLFNSPSTSEKERYGAIDDYPTWEQIAPHLQFFIEGWNDKNVHVIIINCNNREQQKFYNQDKKEEGIRQLEGDHLWVICGGNTISRGLTLAGLTVSYFDRVRKTVAVDTMTQMGRWFGYRRDYELLPRIWMTPETVREMKQTAVVENRMHSSMRDNFEAKFSPSDQSHYQQIYSYGRRLSGRVKSQRKLTVGVGTYGSTNLISVLPDKVNAAFECTDNFLRMLGEPVARSESEYEYARIPYWGDVPKRSLISYLENMKGYYPEASKRILDSLIKEINRSETTDWDVVIGTPVIALADKDAAGRTYSIGGRNYVSGFPQNTPIVGGSAKYISARLHISYYAMIPTQFIRQIDVETFEENFEAIAEKIEHIRESYDGKLPYKIEEALKDTPAEMTIKQRLQKLLANLHDNPALPLPDGIHGRFRDVKKLEGYGNRSSSEYMEKVHESAGHLKPTLQIYPLTPPAACQGLDKPLISLSFYWPKKDPDIFHAVCVGITTKTPMPSRRKFFETVTEVLDEYDFPMQTRQLRATVITRLGEGCTEAFFSQNIRQKHDGHPYLSFDGHNAYFHANWATPPEKAEEKLNNAFRNKAISVIMQESGKIWTRDELFKQVVMEDPKLGAFFKLSDPADRALLVRLLSDDILKENSIKKSGAVNINYCYTPFS